MIMIIIVYDTYIQLELPYYHITQQYVAMDPCEQECNMLLTASDPDPQTVPQQIAG